MSKDMPSLPLQFLPRANGISDQNEEGAAVLVPVRLIVTLLSFTPGRMDIKQVRNPASMAKLIASDVAREIRIGRACPRAL